ncbi:MAG: zinc-binding dehydrogenase [Bacteroidota bacterium]
MRTIVKNRPKENEAWQNGFYLLDKPIPKIKKSEVLIKVFAAAICGTDVGIYNSKDSLRVTMLKAKTNPITIGHEFSGTFAEATPQARKILSKIIFNRAKKIPQIKKLIRGMSLEKISQEKYFSKIIKHFHFTAEMHITCGKCYQCKQNDKHVCQNTIIKGLHDDGAFAEYVSVPAENILLYHKSEIPLEIMAFMDALGNATHTIFSADVKGKDIAVLGCGVQGLMAIAIAKTAGAKNIFVTDASRENFSHKKLIEKRFALAKKFGATLCFDMAVENERNNFSNEIFKITKNNGIEAAFEMSGSYSAYRDVFKVLRMGGTFSLLGLPSGNMEVDFAKEVIFKGITIKGIIGRRVFETWNQMEILLKKGLTKKLISNGFVIHQLPLEKFDDAFELLKNGEAFKILLKP